jgi:hypothetical protein
MTSNLQLDHTVINVRGDMDAAQVLFESLGFTVTPRGYHSLGSINHLMMFGTDYLELIGVPEGGETQRQDLLTAPVGINGLVFKSENVDDTMAHLTAQSLAGDPPKAFHRPVEVDGGSQDAKFRTVAARPGIFPGGRVYFCEHGTPELVWRPEWQSHANGVTAMPEFVVVSEDQVASAENFAKLVGGTVAKADNGLSVATRDVVLTILSPAQYQARYGALASPMQGRQSIFGAMVFKSADLSQIRGIAARLSGVESKDSDCSVMLRLPAYDSVLEFI